MVIFIIAVKYLIQQPYWCSGLWGWVYFLRAAEQNQGGEG